MFTYLMFSVLFALCSARPGNIGFGLGGHGVAVVAAPALAAAPISINSGISQQSRVDIRTPVVHSAVAALPVAIAAPAVAVAPSYANSVTGLGIGAGYGGIGLGYSGIGLRGGYGLGLGH